MNDDTISRKSVIDAVHTATYEFICGAEDGDEMNDADKMVLSINKAVVNAIKALPSVQPEVIRCKDCKWCEDADGLMCKNPASWVVATDYDFGCVCAERRQDG